MKNQIETDLVVIASNAEPHWSDNWNFRSYLKQNIDSVEIDRVALKITAEVSAKIDCTTCGNCCREVYPFMTAEDIDLLAEGTGKPRSEILAQTKIEDDLRVFCQAPCPMLKQNKCSVYRHRPVDCREYPHLDKSDFISRSIGHIQNYGTCPIVYNVLGQMKDCFSYDAQVDYIGDSDPEVDL